MSCHICGSNNYKEFVKFKPIPIQKKLLYLFCNNCGLLYQKEPPQEEALIEYYRNKSHSKGSEKNILKYSENKRPINRYRMDWILAHIKKPSSNKMVDIGCGEGSLVKFFCEAGWDAVGIEPEKELVNFAKRFHGVNISSKLYDGDTFPTSSVGIFTMNQVLEHVNNPAEILCNIRRHLTSDGYLYMEVPKYMLDDREEIARCSFASTHLRLFTPDNLRAYMDKNGFDILACAEHIELVKGHPWTAVLVKKSEYKNIIFTNSVKFSRLKKALINYRIRATVSFILYPFKMIVRFLVNVLFGEKGVKKI